MLHGMVPQRLTSRQMTNTVAERSVLIVDDDEATCRLLADWTRSLGYRVDVTFGAEAALQILRRGTVQVALCDICMPGRDGVWLIDQIGKHCRDVAVVIITGLTKMDPTVTLRPGVTAYITKPFKFEDVAAAISSAFNAIGSDYRQ